MTGGVSPEKIGSLLAQMWVSVPKSRAVPWVDDILMGGSNYIAHPPAVRVDDSGPQDLKNPRSHFVVVRYCRFGWVPGSAGLGDFPPDRLRRMEQITRFLGLEKSPKKMEVDSNYGGFNRVLSPDVVETEEGSIELHHIGMLSKQQRWRKNWVERLFEVKNSCLSYK